MQDKLKDMTYKISHPIPSSAKLHQDSMDVWSLQCHQKIHDKNVVAPAYMISMDSDSIWSYHVVPRIIQ